ncbi:MAG: aspartate carbamoyltransferase [Deltaproteobacteria bacterium]|nr:aspartate carbamoyltransferase [Deltaproteobacteria bacterium]
MKRDLISIDDLGRADLERYLALAAKVEGLEPEAKRDKLPGRVLAVMFFEPSTRTRLSFESAMCRLGGSVLGFSEAASTSAAKGESLRDTARTVERYAGQMVIRPPREGAARAAAEATGVPVINAGDGANQHPSQTLLDLYTIQKFFGGLKKGLRIALVGDLKYSRTIHSLVQALALFEGLEFHLVSPPALRLPGYLMETGAARKASFHESEDLRAAIRRSDVLYMTRIQKERFPDVLDYEKVKDAYVLNREMLEEAPRGLRVMHPLPRVNEIAADVDETGHAGYFEQVGHGLVVRQAVLLDLLGVAPGPTTTTRCCTSRRSRRGRSSTTSPPASGSRSWRSSTATRR